MAAKPESQPMKRLSNIQTFQIRVGNVLEIKHKIPVFIGDPENVCGPDGTPCGIQILTIINLIHSKSESYRTSIVQSFMDWYEVVKRACWSRVGKEILMRFEAWTYKCNSQPSLMVNAPIVGTLLC